MSDLNNQSVTNILTLPGSRNVTGWPLSEIEGMIEPEILKWVADHHPQEASTDELRTMLYQGRTEFNLYPWHPFTALMQAYAGAAAVDEGLPERMSAMSPETYRRCAWFVSARSLEMFKHTYGDFHRVLVSNKDGECKEIGWYIGTVDGNQVFASWSKATERLMNNLTNGYLLDPDTLEPAATSSRLSKWQDYVTRQGDIILPEIRHPAPRKKRVRVKQPEAKKDEQMELPLVVKATVGLPDERVEVRKLFIGMFKSLCTAANFCDGIKDSDPNGCRPIWSTEMENCRVLDLVNTLRETLDDYDKKLGETIVDEHIPEKVLVACATISEMLVPKLAALAAKWLDELRETAVKRS